MQIERSSPIAALTPAPPIEAAARPERTPLDLRRFVLQPQQAPFTPHGALTALDRRDALVGGAMLTGYLVVTTATAVCPALSWWALAGLAGSGAGVAAAVQTGVARRARHVPERDLTAWPLNIQHKAMVQALGKMHRQRPPNGARHALYTQVRQGTAPPDACAAFLRALGPLGSAADTHEALTCMRWHVLLDWRKSRLDPTPPEPTTEEEAADQAIAAAASARAHALWEELERLAVGDVAALLYDEESQRAWVEARLAYALHRGLLPQLLEGSPVLGAHPEWFRQDPGLALRQSHVADFVDYWQRTPALDTRFIEAALNPAWL